MSKEESVLLFVAGSVVLPSVFLAVVLNQGTVMRSLEKHPTIYLGGCLAIGFLGLAIGITGKVIEHQLKKSKPEEQ